MKVSELLFETPLPDDWDKSVYSSHTAFSKKLKYAQERATKIGAGSSRVAFEIEHEGRPTILKIAKNYKGLSQNEFEAQMFSDYYATDLGITIPMIDYDEEHEQPIWIHTEKAQKIPHQSFKKIFGFTPDVLGRYVQWATGNLHNKVSEKELVLFNEIVNDEDNYELLHSLVYLVGNYGLPLGDLLRASNWGMYKGHPVIVDLGLSNEVYKHHYA